MASVVLSAVLLRCARRAKAGSIMQRASRATPCVNVRGTPSKIPYPRQPGFAWYGWRCTRNFFSTLFRPLCSQKDIDVEECSVGFLRSMLLSRAEEVATLNLATNAGIIAGVVLFAVSTVFTVDLVSECLLQQHQHY